MGLLDESDKIGSIVGGAAGVVSMIVAMIALRRERPHQRSDPESRPAAESSGAAESIDSATDPESIDTIEPNINDEQDIRFIERVHQWADESFWHYLVYGFGVALLVGSAFMLLGILLLRLFNL